MRINKEAMLDGLIPDDQVGIVKKAQNNDEQVVIVKKAQDRDYNELNLLISAIKREVDAFCNEYESKGGFGNLSSDEINKVNFSVNKVLGVERAEFDKILNLLRKG